LMHIKLIDTHWMIHIDWYPLIDTHWLIHTDWCTHWLMHIDWYTLIDAHWLMHTDWCTHWLMHIDWCTLIDTYWLIHIDWIHTDWCILIDTHWMIHILIHIDCFCYCLFHLCFLFVVNQEHIMFITQHTHRVHGVRTNLRYALPVPSFLEDAPYMSDLKLFCSKMI